MNHPPIQELAEGRLILVDKPYRWTSFDVIHKLRKPAGAKMGHAGTLDPLATGLLICCTGKATRQISDFQKLPKEYTGIIHLGAVTPTYDLESAPEQFKPYEHITEADALAAAQQFLGTIEQMPPAHSAIKKDGKRAYELARKGEEVKLAARTVELTAFDIVKFALPEVHFRVACSTGTYIRSLAMDFGQALGCGGYLQELRRTKIGTYDVADAWSPAQWIEFWKSNREEAAPAASDPVQDVSAAGRS